MIEYFRTDEQTKTLIKLESEQPGCWIALFNPTQEELDIISNQFDIDEDDIRAPLDLEEISRIERNQNYTMFIVDTPFIEGTHGESAFKTIPIGIYETPSHVISVCSVYRIPIIARLKKQRNDLHDTRNVKRFTCDILLASSEAYFALLQTLNRKRQELSSVVTKPSRKDLEELYALDASIVYLKTSLTTNDTVFERYRRFVLTAHDQETIELFEDVVIENKQALETTKIYSEILDSTIDHFGLLMDSDLNRTMQLVATLTLILCIPTVIGGMFGMNVGGIPLAETPCGFAIITGATVLLLVGVLLLLKKLRWF